MSGRSATTNELLLRRSLRGSKFAGSCGEVGDFRDFGDARADRLGVDRGARDDGGCLRNSHERTMSH